MSLACLLTLISIFLPLASALLLAGLSLFQLRMSELMIRVVVATTVLVGAAIHFVNCLLLFFMSRYYGSHEGLVWYGSNTEFPVHLSLQLDSLSLSFASLGWFLAMIVGHFSATYLAKEPFYLRYFCSFLVFITGMLLVYFAAANFLIMIGWELVGLTSVLLISLFSKREGPVHAGVWVFSTYRIGDIALLAATILLAGNHGGRAVEQPEYSLVISIFILVAAMVKSAQLPFSSWLPRAMEGPTSSSAIFYGSIAIHLGAFLLLRFRELWSLHFVISVLIIIIGVISAWVANNRKAVKSDIKSKLALASIVQVGLIFCEIGLGFYWLPIIHIILHSCYRTLQFLNSPGSYRLYYSLRPFEHPAVGWLQRKTSNMTSLYLRVISAGTIERKLISQLLNLLNKLVAAVNRCESWLISKLGDR